MYGMFSNALGIFLFVMYIFDLLLLTTTPEIQGPLINNKEPLIYKCQEQFYRELLYILYFLCFILHGNWIILQTEEGIVIYTRMVLIINCVYSAFLTISTMIRSVLVYNELVKQFIDWLDQIYGIDQYLYYGNKERELHPPGMYVLLNFYQDGSKFYLANLNMKI